MPQRSFHIQVVIIILLIKALPLSLWSQYEEGDFIRYTMQDGLSDNHINWLEQDERGYLWIGTENGLNRFDGHSFKKYFQQDPSLPLPASQVIRIKSVAPSSLGFVSRGGFFLLDAKDFSSKSFIIEDSTAFRRYLNAPFDVIQMHDGGFATSTESGFYVFDSSGQLQFRHDEFRLEDIGKKTIAYGREIFRISDTEYLQFIRDRDMAYYDAEKRIYRVISADDPDWSVFYPKQRGNDPGYTVRRQISPTEFIFIHYTRNQFVYHNTASNQTFTSEIPLPQNEFNWESRIQMISDHRFALNCGTTGFYLFELNKQTGEFIFHTNKHLPGHKIQQVFVDREGRLWIATRKGLLQQRLKKTPLKSIPIEIPGPDSDAGAISGAICHGEKLFLSRFSSRNGLLILDRQTKKLERSITFYESADGWNEIRSMQIYHPDTIWLGTNSGILWLDTRSYTYGKLTDKTPYRDIPSVNILSPADHDGNTWMCGLMGGIITRYHIPTRSFTTFTTSTTPALPFPNVKRTTTDCFGDIWISGHALARWNHKTQLFDTLITVYAGNNKYEEDILFLIADQYGSLWLNTPANGLLEYRIKEKQWVNYTTNEGLPTNVFYGTSPVIDNHIWLTGPNIVCSFDIVSKKAIVYDHDDGVPDEVFSSRYSYYDRINSELLLFYDHTLATISIPHLSQKEFGGDLCVEEIRINNRLSFFFPDSRLKLNPGEQNILIDFGVVDFESGDDYVFAYRFDDSDEWISVGHQRNLSFTALPADDYAIQLRATSTIGEQKYALAQFSIAPPFWRTFWFSSAMALLGAGILYVFYQNRIRVIRQKANLDRQLSQTEMKALHAQMNPHFVFNSLNSIGEMILHHENDQATHFLGRFANLIRMTLDQSGQSFISLRHTMTYLTNYIEMEQIRNNEFTYEMIADENLDLDETVLPPMLIQPFIENAIWHGTSASRKDIHIQISFLKNHEYLICNIDDNGKGIERSLKQKKEINHHQPVGIINIKNRIQLLNEKYGLKSSLTIVDKSTLESVGTGTRVTIKLPLEIAEDE